MAGYNPFEKEMLIKAYRKSKMKPGEFCNLHNISTTALNNWMKKYDEDTIYSYLRALKKLFVIEESEAWNPNHRSKTAICIPSTCYLLEFGGIKSVT